MNSSRRWRVGLGMVCLVGCTSGGALTAAGTPAPIEVTAQTHFETHGVDGASAWGEVTVPYGEKARVNGWVRDDKCDNRNAAVKIVFDYPLIGNDKAKYIVNNTDGKCGANHLRSFDVSEQTYSLNAIYVQEYTDNWWSSERWGARIKVWSK